MHKPVPVERFACAPLVLAVLALAGTDTHAQDNRRGLTVTPTFSATQTWTDNRTLSSTNKESDFVTQITPGVRVQSSTGIVTGVLDYQLTGVIHRKLSELNQTQNTFNSALLVQPPGGRFSVAARASLARQTVSAFGVQSADPLLETRNTTEVASAGITPRFSGTLGGLVDYNVQVSRDLTRAKDTSAGDSSSTSAMVGLSGRVGRLGWGLDAMRMRVAYRLQPKTTDDRAYASLLWFPDADLRLSARVGQDRSDALGSGTETTTTYGGGVAWTPSPRTTFSFDADRRYFGNSHSLSFDYRTARTLWRISDSRSASSFSGSSTFQITGMDYARDQLRRWFGNTQLTDAQVIIAAQQLLPWLNLRGVADIPFLVSTRSLNRQTDFSFLYSGLRTSFGLNYYRSQADSLQSTDLFGDFKTPSAKFYGLTVSANHRLTPRDSVSLIGGYQRTPDAGLIPGNSLKSLNLLWSTQPTRRTTVTLGGRHVIFDGPESYDETGLNATLSLQF